MPENSYQKGTLGSTPAKEKEPYAFDNILTGVQDADIDNMKPEMLRAHLMLLTKFKALEQADEQIDVRYLLRAQERYLLWLDLLGSQNFNPGMEFIPPIDVCYIWHSHLLSPIQYYEDMMRIYDPIQKFSDFPLKRLASISLFFVWVKNTEQPWVLDPNDSSDFKMKCPWCKDIIYIPWGKYVKLIQNIEVKEKCPTCKVSLSVETLSCKRFIDDIVEWNKNKAKFIGGTLVDPKDGSCSELFAINNSSLLFSTADSNIKNLTVSKSLSWNHIIKELDNHVNQLKKITDEMKKKIKIIVRRTVFTYIGIPFPFSIDLIGAVLRQREFTEKVVNNEMINRTEVQANAIIRYLKFLFLMKEKQNIILVPTLDIDLCWYTHQIHASPYRQFTKKHIGRIINHDDTLAEGVLSDGFAVTAGIWYKKYREPYTHDNSSKIWLTAKKKIMSVIIPYGLLVHNQLKKYRKIVTKQHEKDIEIHNGNGKNVESAKNVERVENEKAKEKRVESVKNVDSEKVKEKRVESEKAKEKRVESVKNVDSEKVKEKRVENVKNVESEKVKEKRVESEKVKEKRVESVKSAESGKVKEKRVKSEKVKEKRVESVKGAEGEKVNVKSAESGKVKERRVRSEKVKEKRVESVKGAEGEKVKEKRVESVKSAESGKGKEKRVESVKNLESGKVKEKIVESEKVKEKRDISSKYPIDKITKITPLNKSVVTKASSKQKYRRGGGGYGSGHVGGLSGGSGFSGGGGVSNCGRD
ncbi:hypothetical protein Glove_535g33 [Diversispora epigaea]|uniref:Uncharacterized protein n=1 Tax=Diversispora epigaea TaxID=1348612 RepID=A0A397GD72_9GLOM|nr:hypothetical protein Glove_535g33 [Diversispora epigaea]